MNQGRGTENDVVFIAVGRNYEKERANVNWVKESFPGSPIVILHVNQPGKSFLRSVKLFDGLARKMEAYKISNMLSKYLEICTGREVTTLTIENADIAAGIEELMRSYHIQKLVLGSWSVSRRIALLNSC